MHHEDEHDDDKPVGRILKRREVLGLLGGLGAAIVAGGGTARAASNAAATVAQTGTTQIPSCVVRPELTEGPYFVDEQLNRSDIRRNGADGAMSQGTKLELTFLVSSVGSNSCAPLPGAQVDVWHCDALGVYSGVQGSQGTDFLRGYQITDSSGVAAFTTIYPGWYRGRAVHIHFKIRVNAASGQDYEFTAQLFFPDALSDQVYTAAPYSAKGPSTTRNSADGIYRNGGSQLLLDVTSDGAGGYQATFTIGLADVPASAVPTPTVPPTTPASSESHLFTATGFTVSGDFWTTWQGERAYEDSLYVNGLPITEERDEVSPTDGKTYRTQWFERARYEYHPENVAPFKVLLGLLGAAAASGREAEEAFKPVANPRSRLLWFPETQHTVGDSSEAGQAIATFWSGAGGINQFGFPLSQPFSEVSKDDGKSYVVQYFERQRLEYHPENSGTHFQVLLGRLGAEQVG